MAEDAKVIHIQLTVMVNNGTDAVRVSETLSRQMTGLALEGYTTTMMVMTLEDTPNEP
jgi:hypothetical protein